MLVLFCVLLLSLSSVLLVVGLVTAGQGAFYGAVVAGSVAAIVLLWAVRRSQGTVDPPLPPGGQPVEDP